MPVAMLYLLITLLFSLLLFHCCLCWSYIIYTPIILSFLFIEHLLVNNSYAILLSSLFVLSLSVTSGKCLRCALCLCSSFSLSFVTYTNGPLDSFGLPLPRCQLRRRRAALVAALITRWELIFSFFDKITNVDNGALALSCSLLLSLPSSLSLIVSFPLSLWLPCKICLCL